MALKSNLAVWCVVVLCLLVIIAGAVGIGVRLGRERVIEVIPPETPLVAGSVYIGGEVNNPGIYPYEAGDTLDELIRAAGGLTGDADASYLELNVPRQGWQGAPQKVNINTAEVWLLEALPGVGEKRARAIVDYRMSHGYFRDVNELLEVEGFGLATLEKIRGLITVGD
ncbi:MAG: ComEA family DNA-binding protein [Dehalococcoidales bacterium]|nr:ComEA family DNA-binding protein [Dehalococcoidales bacterium]